MADWEQRLNGFLTMWDREVLQDAGKISAEMARLHAETEFEKYRIVQDHIYVSDFDRFMLEEEHAPVISFLLSIKNHTGIEAPHPQVKTQSTLIRFLLTKMHVSFSPEENVLISSQVVQK